MWGGKQDELQALKLRQIDTLRQFFPNVREITRNTQYEVPITLPSRNTISLRINLGNEFPRLPPQLQVLPPVLHPLVDSNMNILPSANENLQRWSIHAPLGKTVYEIVQRLTREPPQILQNQGNFSIPQNNNAPNEASHTAMPAIPSSFPELESKSMQELTLLLNDEMEFKKFFESLECVRTMKGVAEDVQRSNENAAKRNLAAEETLRTLRLKTSQRSQELKEHRKLFDDVAQRQQKVMQKFSTSALLNRLESAAEEAESLSDATATEFLQGNTDVKTFVKDFFEKRKLYHLRSAKRESLAMLSR